MLNVCYTKKSTIYTGDCNEPGFSASTDTSDIRLQNIQRVVVEGEVSDGTAVIYIHCGDTDNEKVTPCLFQITHHKLPFLHIFSIIM